LKSDQIADDFMQTDAYSVLFMELVTDADKASEFVRGLVPRDLSSQAEQAVRRARQDNGLPETTTPDISTVPQPAVEGISGDREAQAAKPQPEGLPQPTPFPQSLEAAVVATHSENMADPSASDDPLWYQQNRYPTKQELMAMGSEEMQFAMKLKNARAFG
jgi:hypothetical protein